MEVKWKYIPIVGIIVTFVAHYKAVDISCKDPHQTKLYEATWDAGENCLISITSTVLLAIVAMLITTFTTR